MSWQATDAIDKLPVDVVGPLAFRVLLKLANVADQRGERAWRSKTELAIELGRSQRSIQRAFRELEHAAVIFPGDQSFVQHLRADRRPTVYNVNMRWSSEFEQPELEVFDGETLRGDTVIHSPHGETPQVHTGRQLLSHIEPPMNSTNSSTRANHRAPTDDPCPFSKSGHLRVDEENDSCARCGLTPEQRYDPASKSIRRLEVTS